MGKTQYGASLGSAKKRFCGFEEWLESEIVGIIFEISIFTIQTI